MGDGLIYISCLKKYFSLWGKLLTKEGKPMTVLIRIDYVSNENRIYSKGEFPLKGKSREEVALEFWRWLKRDHPYECKLENVLCDGEDITELVVKLENAPLD
jgi:hypothetical protein